MEAPASARLFAHFATVREPRRANARHPLFALFVIALCAVISGAEGWEDMEEYGQAQAPWCEEFFALPHGMPSPDTFRRGLSRLKPDELSQCVVTWTEALRESLDGDLSAVDGKTLRRSCDHAAATGALPKLLKMLELQGAIVTIEALGWQTESARTMTGQGAESVLALKANHATLHGAVHLFFGDLKAERFDHISSAQHRTVDADHGRLEKRHSWRPSEIDC